MNLALIGCGLLISLVVLLALRLRGSKISVTDFLFVHLGLGYGAAAILSSFSSRETMSEWVGKFDSETFIMVEVGALVIYLTAVLTALAVFRGRKYETDILSVREGLASVSRGATLFLVFLVVLLTGYGYLRYGVIGGLVDFASGDTIAGVFADAPYWFTSAYQVLPIFSFATTIIIWSKVLRGGVGRYGKVGNLIYLIFLAIMLVIDLLNGRRTLMYVIIVMSCFYLSSRGMRLGFRGLFIAIIGFSGLLISSNMYQAYRNQIGDVRLSVILSNWSAVSRTLKNVNIRRPEWALDYMVLKSIESGSGSLGGGEILMQGIENATPSFLSSDKRYQKSDVILWRLFDLPNVDLPDTPLAIVMGDFGFVSALLIVPLIYLFLIVIPSFVLCRRFKSYKIFYALFICSLIFMLIDVELDFYTALLNFWRNAAILFLCFVIVPRMIRGSGRVRFRCLNSPC